MTVFATLGVYSRLGGEQRYDQALTRALANAGDSTIVALWDDRTHASAAPRSTRFLPCDGSKIHFMLAFLRAVRSGDTVVLGHVLLAPLAIWARLRGARVLLIAYGLEVWAPPGVVRRLIVRRCVDRVVAISGHTARTMAQRYALPRERFDILPPSIDVAHDPPTSLRDAALVLSVTRLGAHAADKGVDTVIRALPRVRRAIGGVRYEVVGPGAARAGLAVLAERMGVGDIVTFRGEVSEEELEDRYAQASVFVLPSAQEGFGIVFLEAWRHRLPVIAADAAAATEVVRGRGLLVPPGDDEALADALIALLGDRTAREALGTAGHAALHSYAYASFEDEVRRIVSPAQVAV